MTDLLRLGIKFFIFQPCPIQAPRKFSDHAPRLIPGREQRRACEWNGGLIILQLCCLLSSFMKSLQQEIHRPTTENNDFVDLTLSDNESDPEDTNKRDIKSHSAQPIKSESLVVVSETSSSKKPPPKNQQEPADRIINLQKSTTARESTHESPPRTPSTNTPNKRIIQNPYKSSSPQKKKSRITEHHPPSSSNNNTTTKKKNLKPPPPPPRRPSSTNKPALPPRHPDPNKDQEVNKNTESIRIVDPVVPTIMTPFEDTQMVDKNKTSSTTRPDVSFDVNIGFVGPIR